MRKTPKEKIAQAVTSNSCGRLLIYTGNRTTSRCVYVFGFVCMCWGGGAGFV